MSKRRSREPGFGLHLHMLRQRARRPDPKSRAGRDNARLAQIERSRRESQ